MSFDSRSQSLLLEPIGGRAQSVRMVLHQSGAVPITLVYVWAPGRYLIWFIGSDSSFTRVQYDRDYFTPLSARYGDVNHVVQHRLHPDLFLLLRRPGGDVVDGGERATRLEIVRVTDDHPVQPFRHLGEYIFDEPVYDARWRYGVDPFDAEAVLVDFGSHWDDLAGQRVRGLTVPPVRGIMGPELRADPTIGADKIISDVLVGEELMNVTTDGAGLVLAVGNYRKPLDPLREPPILDAGWAYRDWIRLSRRLLSAALPASLAQYVLYRSLPGTY